MTPRLTRTHVVPLHQLQERGLITNLAKVHAVHLHPLGTVTVTLQLTRRRVAPFRPVSQLFSAIVQRLPLKRAAMLHLAPKLIKFKPASTASSTKRAQLPVVRRA